MNQTRYADDATLAEIESLRQHCVVSQRNENRLRSELVAITNDRRKAEFAWTVEQDKLRQQLATVTEERDLHANVAETRAGSLAITRAELAATQASLKEAMEALEAVKTDAEGYEQRTGSKIIGWLDPIRAILSHPANTSALDRLLAEEDAQIKQMLEALSSCEGAFDECRDYQIAPQMVINAPIAPEDTLSLNRERAKVARTLGDALSNNGSKFAASVCWKMADELEGR